MSSITIHIDNLNIHLPPPEACATTDTCDVDTSTPEPAVSVEDLSKISLLDLFSCPKDLIYEDIVKVGYASDKDKYHIGQFVSYADPDRCSVLVRTDHPNHIGPVPQVFYFWERA